MKKYMILISCLCAAGVALAATITDLTGPGSFGGKKYYVNANDAAINAEVVLATASSAANTAAHLVDAFYSTTLTATTGTTTGTYTRTQFLEVTASGSANGATNTHVISAASAADIILIFKMDSSSTNVLSMTDGITTNILGVNDVVAYYIDSGGDNWQIWTQNN